MFSQLFDLYNGNPYTSKDRLYIATEPGYCCVRLLHDNENDDQKLQEWIEMYVISQIKQLAYIDGFGRTVVTPVR